MIVFTHSNPTVGTLYLRLSPTSVQWTYNLNTAKFDTYGGQVVQLLSINFDKLILAGRFGQEGPHGRNTNNDGTSAPRSVDEFFAWQPIGGSGSIKDYRIGLTQMTEYFSRYFSVASQGHDAHAQGNFDQDPMQIKYDGVIDVEVDAGMMETDWYGYPVNFPSYKRSNMDFAPEWQVEFQIFEAPAAIRESTHLTELAKLQNVFLPKGVGWRPSNPFSDPLGAQILQGAKSIQQAIQQADAEEDRIYDYFAQYLPAYSDDALTQLVEHAGSIPIKPDDSLIAKINKVFPPARAFDPEFDKSKSTIKKGRIQAQ